MKSERGRLQKLATLVSLTALMLLPLIACRPAEVNSEVRPSAGDQVKAQAVGPVVNINGNLTFPFPNRHVLYFETYGRVEEVLVKKGDRVNAGQLLARLANKAQSLAVDNARDNVSLAKNNFAKRICPPYGCFVGPSQAMVCPPYTENAYEYIDGPGVVDTFEIMQEQIDRTVKSLESANYLDARKELAALQDNLDRSKRILEDSYIKEFVYGINENVFIQFTLQLDQAKIALQNAQLELKKTLLVAPFGGIVDDVGLKEGDVVSAVNQTSLWAVMLIDTSAIQMEGTVDEVDMARVKVGQKAIVSLDSLPGVQLTGKLSYVSILGGVRAGVPYYGYVVTLQPPFPIELKQGMRATASLAPGGGS